MNLNILQRLSGFLLLSLFLFSACPEDDGSMEEIPPEITVFNNEGFYIVNEGADGVGTGSISYYHRDYETIVNNIFQEANNGNSIGQGLKHLAIINEKAYIIASQSNKIVIANPVDMTKIGEINGFQNPTYILQTSPDKAYVSQWGADGQSGSIEIVDLNTNTITGSIPVRPGPQELNRIGNSVYVTNSGGLFVDSIITKINAISDEVLKTIKVGPAPTYMEVDRDLNLWVLTRGEIVNPGNPSENIRGRLVKIENDEVTLSLNVRPSANSLCINQTRDILYFVQNGWVYEHPIESTSISLVPFIERSFYGLDVDPQTNYLIGLDAKNLSQNGDLIIFDTEKNAVDTAEAGSVPRISIFK